LVKKWLETGVNFNRIQEVFNSTSR